MRIDQLIAFHRTFGSCVLGPPQKNYFFAVPRRGSFGRMLTMQLEPPKPVASMVSVPLTSHCGPGDVAVAATT